MSSNVILYGKNYDTNTIIPVAVDNSGDLRIISDTPTNLSNLLDVNITGVSNSNLLQYDSVTSKWINRSELTGNIGFSNLSVSNTLTCDNLIVSDDNSSEFGNNLTIQNGGYLIMRDSNTIINSPAVGNLDMSSLYGNINITANADIILTTNTGGSVKIMGSGGLPIASFSRDIIGNSYISFGTTIGETGYGFKANTNGDIFVKSQNGTGWNQLSNVNIAIGNTTVKLGNAYAGLDLSNSTGYKSINLVGNIPVTLISDASLTNSKLANNTIILAGRQVALGSSNTINLSNLSDVSMSGVATNDIVRYNGTNWINSNAVVLSNITVRNATDTTGVCICPDLTNTPRYGLYVGYTYGANIAGFPSSLVTTANSSTRWAAAFHNTLQNTTNTEVVAFTRLLSNGSIVKTGAINNSNSITSYNSVSDYRLKSNVRPLEDGLNIINRLNPVSFTWNLTGLPGDGFIAHELAEVVPDAVSGNKDDMTPEGLPEYQGIDTSMLAVYLVRSVQQLDEKVKALRTEINKLKKKKTP